MSSDAVARWNAISLNRPDPNEAAQPSLKRTRPDGDGDEDESEDDVSLVSRSPSPPPPDAMDIDKYDEYYSRKPEREVITVETKIKSTNVGFSMLAKMGWVEGSPLGLSGDGRVDPVPFYVKNDLTGLGKANQDVRMIETTVSQRRKLDSEQQIKETEEQRKQREEAVARRVAVQSELSSVLRPFYCEVCEKQFQNVAQYDEHTNSYAHHHKVRFRDMQATQRASRNTKEEVDKRKEKERKREEKELRKIAKAAGVKMAKPPVALAPAGEPSSMPGGPAKSGWATLGSSAAAVQPAEPPKRSGWATVGDTHQSSGSTSTRGGWANAGTPASPSGPPAPPSAAPPSPPTAISGVPPRNDYSTAPAFRTAGWTSLETGGSVPPPPPPALPHHAPPPSMIHAPGPPPPVPRETRGGWGPVSVPPSAGGWSSTPPTAAHPPPVPPFGALPPSAPQTSRLPPPPKPAAGPTKEASRSGWQNFRAGAPGRRR
ncbi:hypothetical protein VTO73DRAFT_1319 [Trametes versicolor]